METSTLTLVAEVAPQKSGWTLSDATGLDLKVLKSGWEARTHLCQQADG